MHVRPEPSLVIFFFALTIALLFVFQGGDFSGSAQAAPTTTSLKLSGAAATQYSSLTGQAAAVQSQIDNLDIQLELATEDYNQLSDQLDNTNSNLTSARQELSRVQTRLQEQQDLLAARVVAVYKSGGSDQLLEILLLSHGLDDFVNRVRWISAVSDQDKDILAGLEDAHQQTQDLESQIEAQKQQEIALREKMTEQKAQINAKLADRSSILAGINGQIRTLLAQEQARQQQEELLLQQQAAKLVNLPQNGTEVQRQLVQTAAAYLGIPYLWGGSSPATGMDCSGFTRFVFMQHGVNLPHYALYQSQMGVEVSLADVQPGDLLAFGHPVHHVGIYIGDGLFIQSPRTGDVIKISKLSDRTDLNTIRRFTLKMRVGPPLTR